MAFLGRGLMDVVRVIEDVRILWEGGAGVSAFCSRGKDFGGKR